jgi:hypothetical protein
MSELVLDGGYAANLLHPYLGQTRTGKRTTGKDVEHAAHLTEFLRLVSSTTVTSDEPTPEISDLLTRFSKLVDGLRRLLQAPESDDFGLVRPSQSSVAKASAILFPLVQRRFSIPEPFDIGTDHDGAIRMTWENGPRSLELVVPYERDAAAYFYYSDADHYGMEEDLTPTGTSNRFEWLQGV